MTTDKRVYDFDADLDHEWAKQSRIPLVATWWPRWKYEVALVVPPLEDRWLHPVTCWPTEDEAAVVASTIEYRMGYYNAGWAAKMRERALDVDSSTNTLILGKTTAGWRYRLATWDRGPVVWPAYDAPVEVAAPYTPDRGGLIALLDHWKRYGDSVFSSWHEWKTGRPEVFA